MNAKKVIGLLLLIILVGIWIHSLMNNGYRITEVVDGNTVVLNTGTTVRLIGVSSTEQGKEKLEQLKAKYKFVVVPDKHALFNPKALNKNMTVYAYLSAISGSHRHSINAMLLKEGLASYLDIEELSDSTQKYRDYANLGAGKRNLTPTIPKKLNYAEDAIVLPNPPYIPDSTRLKRRSNQHFYRDSPQNLSILKSACDYDCEYTRTFAAQLAARSEGSFNTGQICEIFKYCYDKWRYVNDPKGEEYIANASESISNSLIGDCDDFAILMGSCILAIGGYVCINLAYNDDGGHAFTEVDIAPIGSISEIKSVIKNKFPQYESNISSLNVRTEGEHQWLNLDWFSAYPGGKYYDYNRIERYSCINGTWSR